MSLRNSILLFLSALLVSVLPTLAAANEETETIETPWLVFISEDTNNLKNSSTTSEKKTCPGVLIDPQLVLTTATCLDINLEKTKNLIVEAHNQSHQVSQVSLREFNPQYFLHNNYAVLKLSEPFLLSSNLNTITLASVNEYLNMPKCRQLTYYGKSPDNKTISKVMGKVLISNYTQCYQDMIHLRAGNQKPYIFWHPSILCSGHIHLLQCLELKDWSSMLICPRYYQPNTSVFIGFQQTFLVFDTRFTEKNYTVNKDDCIMLYANMFEAYPWIEKQRNNLNGFSSLWG